MGQRSKSVEGRVVGALLLVVVHSGCLGMLGIKPTVAGEVRTFPEFNFQYVMPGEAFLEVPGRAPTAFTLVRTGGKRLSFRLLAERLEAGDNALNADLVSEHQRKSLRNAARQVESGPVQPRALNGVHGLQFRSTSITDSGRTSFLHWTAVHNGFVFQVECQSAELDPDSLAAEVTPLLDAFSLVDPARLSYPGVAARYTGHGSETYGYAFAPAGDFRVWPKFEEVVPGADTATLAGQWEGVALFPLLLVDPDVADAALAKVLLDEMGLEPPADAAAVSPIERADVKGQLVRTARTNDGTEYEYRLFVMRAGLRAWLLAAWNVRGKSDIEALATRTLNGFRLLPGAVPTLASLPEKAREHQARLQNAVGLALLESDAPASLPWFRSAQAARPVHLPYASNVLAALNRTGRHDEALAFLEDRAPLLKEDAIRGWRAWHRKRAGDDDGALADYRDLFLESHTDDDDFDAYVTLLEGREDWAEAERVLARQQAVTESFRPRLREAKYLAERGNHARAIELLERLRRTVPAEEAVNKALFDALHTTGRFDDAVKLAKELNQGQPKETDWWWQRTLAHARLRQWADAKTAVEQLLALDPDAAQPKVMLAELKARLGETPTGLPEPAVAPVPIPKEIAAILEVPTKAPVPTGDTYLEESVVGMGRGGDGRFVVTTRDRLRFATEKGVNRYLYYDFGFDRDRFQRSVNEARLLGADGKELWRSGPRDAVLLESDPGEEQAVLRLRFPRPLVGSMLEVTSTLAYTQDVEHVPVRRESFDHDEPIRRAVVYVSGDLSKLKHVALNLPAPKPLAAGGLSWVVENVPVVRTEPLPAPADTHRPVLWTGDPAVGWPVIGDRFLAKLGPPGGDEAIVRETVAAVVGDVMDPKEKLRLLLAFVRGYTADDGEGSVRFKAPPAAAAEVIARKKGTCLELALLLRALLTSAGLESQLALTAFAATRPELGSIYPFSHALVRVPSLGLTVDPAVPAREGLRNASDRVGAELLLLAPGSSRLERLPPEETDAFVAKVERDVRVDGPELLVDETIRFGQLAAVWFRREDVHAPMDRFRWAQGLLKRTMRDASLVRAELVDVESPGQDDEPVLKLRYRLRGRPLAPGARVPMPASLESDWVRVVAKEARQGPYLLLSPTKVDVVTRFHPSVAATPGSAIPEEQGLAKGLSWRGSRAVEGGVVVTRWSYGTRSGQYAASEFAEYAAQANRGVSFVERAVELSK